MKTLNIQIAVQANGRLRLDHPIDLPIGHYQAVLVIEEQPLQSSTPANITHAQALLRKYISPERQLSQELIQERRQESHNE